MEIGFYHPVRGYWQAIDVSKDIYTVVVEPERIEIEELEPARIEIDEDDQETVIPAVTREIVVPAVTRETSQFDELLAAYPEGTIEVPLKPGADFDWLDGEWTYVAPDPEPLPPLTARQLRLGLIAAGITLSSVEAAISGIEDATDREIAKVEWEYASQFERDHPLIGQVGAALGLTPGQIDAAWLAAVNL